MPVSLVQSGPRTLSAGAATALFQENTLTTGTTNITSPTTPAAGDLFVLVLVQDATGGRQVTFSSDFSSLVSVDISPYPDKRTLFLLVGRGDNKWYPVAAPFLEV